MKKILFLSAAICLLAISAFAQNRPDYSGDWELDTVNSKLDERMRVQLMTLRVNQTEKEITVGTFTKRVVREDANTEGKAFILTPQAATYSLVEGTATKAESVSSDGAGTKSESTTLKAAFESDGKLKLNSVRNYDTQAGKMTVTVNEVWELADEGRTLKVSRTMESPRGTSSMELVFTKTAAPVSSGGGNGVGGTLKGGTVSGGVLNGKATSLVKPVYPEAARAVKAGGAVNVQVTIDEAGNVISATAVSGHPLLRAASEDAARASTFSPTLLQGVPVKVTGIIVYNFTP